MNTRKQGSQRSSKRLPNKSVMIETRFTSCIYRNVLKTTLLLYKWYKFWRNILSDVCYNNVPNLPHLYTFSENYSFLTIVWSTVIHNVDWKWEDLFIFIPDNSCTYCWLSLRKSLHSCLFLIYKKGGNNFSLQIVGLWITFFKGHFTECFEII